MSARQDSQRAANRRAALHAAVDYGADAPVPEVLALADVFLDWLDTDDAPDEAAS